LGNLDITNITRYGKHAKIMRYKMYLKYITGGRQKELYQFWKK